MDRWLRIIRPGERLIQGCGVGEDKGEGEEGTVEEEPGEHGEEHGGAPEGEGREGVQAFQAAGKGGEEGEEDEVGEAEGEAQGVAEGREDKEQVIE